MSRVEGCLGVLEIGPGPGVLTRPLTLAAAKVIAVEVDRSILPVLHEYAPMAEVVAGDALKSDLAKLLNRLPEPRAVVSNMPYNITGPLLEAFSRTRSLYSKAVLMMQREVAQKILAQPGDSDRGALSVVMQAYFDISKVCQVPPGAFVPPPKVDSTVLEFVPLASGLSDQGLDDVIRLVRAGFTQPRKTVANNLSAILGAEEAKRRLETAGFEGRLRPHQLTWEQWKSLAT